MGLRSITSTPTTSHTMSHQRGDMWFPPFETPPNSDMSSFLNQTDKEVSENVIFLKFNH